MTRSTREFLKYLFMVCPVLCLPSCSPQANDETLPNVVFIMADDMGWGDVESYHPESLIPTPNISLVFDLCFISILQLRIISNR